MSEVTERIKEIRKAMAVTQRVFASSLGISRSHVANLETGNTEPSEHLLLLMCEKFQLNLDWLKLGRGPMSSTAELSPQQVRKIEDVFKTSSYRLLVGYLDGFLKIYDQMAATLTKSCRDALKSDPTFCPVELIESLKQLLARKESEPFKSAEKLLKKCEPHARPGLMLDEKQ